MRNYPSSKTWHKRGHGDKYFCGSGIPNYPTSLDAIFAAEERLGLHDPDAFGFREVWLRFAAFTIREDRGQCLTTNSVAFLPPPLRLIPFILTAQWKEQNQ